jgi:hypothetical protein
MDKNKQRIAIAEASGRKRQEPDSCFFDDPTESFQVYVDDLPDYLNDLNAMHEAEWFIMNELSVEYVRNLEKISCIWHASAAQRAEAFLKTLNLWDV